MWLLISDAFTKGQQCCFHQILNDSQVRLTPQILTLQTRNNKGLVLKKTSIFVSGLWSSSEMAGWWIYQWTVWDLQIDQSDLCWNPPNCEITIFFHCLLMISDKKKLWWQQINIWTDVQHTTSMSSEGFLCCTTMSTMEHVEIQTF